MVEKPPAPFELSENNWISQWAVPKEKPVPSHAPTLRTLPENEQLIRLRPGCELVEFGEPVRVECRLTLAARSALTRKPITIGGAGMDKRYKRAAFLIALDSGLLQAQGAGYGIAPMKAARKKLLAKGCQCAPRINVSDLEGQYREYELKVEPRTYSSVTGEALVLLQVVVESTIDKANWTPVGEIARVRVRVADPAIPGMRAVDDGLAEDVFDDAAKEMLERELNGAWSGVSYAIPGLPLTCDMELVVDGTCKSTISAGANTLFEGTGSWSVLDRITVEVSWTGVDCACDEISGGESESERFDANEVKDWTEAAIDSEEGSVYVRWGPFVLEKE